MIISETVRLRAIERQDLPLFVAWLNDPEVRQHLHGRIQQVERVTR